MPETKHRILKKLLLVLVIIIPVAVGSILLFQYFNGDKVRQLIVGEINKHLAVKATVDGTEISIIRSFPYASLILSNTALQPPAELINAPGLLHAEKISLKFNLINIITGRYSIHSIAIHNASLTIYEDQHGGNNYNIWKKTSNTGNESVKFNIQRLTLTSSKVYYRNLLRNDDIAIAVSDMLIKGSIQQDEFLMKLKGDCYNERMIIAGEKVLPPGQASIESAVDINTLNKELDFRESKVIFAGINTQFNGNYNYGLTPTIDFKIISLTSDLKNLLAVAPERAVKALSDYDINGRIKAEGTLKGPVTRISSLAVTTTFDITGGKFDYTSKKFALKDINTSGTFTYKGLANSEVLNLTTFAGNIKTGKLKGSTTIRNFNNPHVNMVLSVQADASEFASLIENSELREFRGNLIADLKYNGHYKPGTRMDKNLTGQVSLMNAGFEYNKNQISNIDGLIEFNENKLHFSGLTCTIGTSDLKANGYIENLVSHLLNEEQNIHAFLNLYSGKLILEDILALVGKKTSPSLSTSMFPPHISFKVLLSVNSLTYKKLITNDITGVFMLDNDILRGSNIIINALDGSITANGLINGRYGNKARIVTKAEFKDVNITKFFYQFNEFGQNSIVSSNLKGTSNASVDFATNLYSDFSVNTETIEAIADVEIRNGELNDFEPLQALSRFLDASELRNVRFETLKNRIEITRKTVLIPRMEIKSSALDLSGYGTHTFGNDIDYHVNMLLSDVLRAKRKRNVEEVKYIEDDGYGKPRLFLKLSGPIDDPIVQYDTKAVKGKIVDDFKNEKKVFRDVIHKEFGKKDVRDNPAVNPSTGVKPVEFQIEWDETK